MNFSTGSPIYLQTVGALQEIGGLFLAIQR